MTFPLDLIFLTLSVYAADKMPSCVRPYDFAMGKFVASYEACLSRQDKFCSTHKSFKECEARVEKPTRPFYKSTVDDIDPTKRCKIARDLTYRCIQDPVRFMAPTNNEGNPVPAPVVGGPSPSSGPSSSDVPFETPSPNGSGTDPAASPAQGPAAGPAPLHQPKK